MADLIFVVVTFAFFGVALLLVRACDRIIGPDPAPAEAADTADASDPADPADPVPSSAREVVHS
jgi:hypothetical protein